MARRRYIITYDISDPKRLRGVARTLEGYGVRLQFSVFECLLDTMRLSKAKTALAEIIDSSEDQVLFISLGLETNDAGLSMESLGRPYRERTLVTIV
jgi:CRISPR-associated protein Cas2